MTLPDFWLRALAVMALDGFEIRTRDRHGEEHSAVRFTGARAEMPAPLVSRTPACPPRALQPQIVTGGACKARNPLKNPLPLDMFRLGLARRHPTSVRPTH